MQGVTYRFACSTLVVLHRTIYTGRECAAHTEACGIANERALSGFAIARIQTWAVLFLWNA